MFPGDRRFNCGSVTARSAEVLIQVNRNEIVARTVANTAGGRLAERVGVESKVYAVEIARLRLRRSNWLPPKLPRSYSAAQLQKPRASCAILMQT